MVWGLGTRIQGSSRTFGMCLDLEDSKEVWACMYACPRFYRAIGILLKNAQVVPSIE